MATILIVDDQPVNRKSLLILLRSSGHRLLEATDGGEALRVVRAEHPDLVITDILMPTMDGYEFVRRLRADPSIAPTPVIFYTAAYDQHEVETLARAAGVFQVIIKPCRPEELLGTLEAALGLTGLPPSSLQSNAFTRQHRRLLTDKLFQKVAQLEQEIANRQRAEEALAAVTQSLNDGVYTVDRDGQVMFANAALERLTGYRVEELLGHLSTKFYTAEAVPMLSERRRQAFAGQAVASCVEAELLRNDGGRVPVELSTANLMVRGEIVARAVVVRDLTERKRDEAEAERRRREAEVMADLGRTITASLDLPTVLQWVVEGAKKVCTSDIASIALRQAGSEAMVIRHWTGTRYQGYEATPIQPWKGIGGLALATAQPQRTDLYAEEPRISKEYMEVIREEEIVAAMAVPIRIGDRAHGVIYVANRVPRPFTDQDEGILLRLADYAAVAIHNARLYEEVHLGHERLRALSRRLVEVQEDERRLLARELHDEIGQALTAVKINLQAITRLPGASPLVPHLEESMGIIEHTLQQVRNLSLDLRPSLLDDLGLVAALRWYVDRQAQRAGFVAQVVADPLEAGLSPEIETACFRVAQEALTNVVRHARGRRVWVTLRRADTELHLVIRDDGVGFDVQSAWESTGGGSNLGLLGMQERVALLGGQLEIQSAPTQGTEIQARFPLIAFPRWEKERRREGERGRR